MTRYSPSKGCFYPPEIKYSPENLPDDLIPTSKEFMNRAFHRGPKDTLEVVDGEVVLKIAPESTIEDVRAEQVALLQKAYSVALASPVTYTTKVGVTAIFPQTDQPKNYLNQCLTAGKSAWTYNLWLDVDSVPVSPFTFEDLQGLSHAIVSVDQDLFPRLMDRISKVQTASSVDEVKSIVF